MQRSIHRKFWYSNTVVVTSFFLLSFVTIWVSLEAQHWRRLFNFNLECVSYATYRLELTCRNEGVNDRPDFPFKTCHEHRALLLTQEAWDRVLLLQDIKEQSCPPGLWAHALEGAKSWIFTKAHSSIAHSTQEGDGILLIKYIKMETCCYCQWGTAVACGGILDADPVKPVNTDKIHI